MILDNNGFSEPKEVVTDLEELGKRSDEINVAEKNADVRATVVALKETIRANNLIGLSAPQIGIYHRIFCINFNGDIRSFINPIITDANKLEISTETCASIPGKTFIRPRHPEIEACYSTPLGKIESRKFIGKAAFVFQHLLDHLDGLLLPDVGLEVGEDFFNATEEEQSQVVDMYLDSLDIKRKDLAEEIENDKDLKQMSDAIDFMTKLAKGEVTVVKGERIEQPPEESNAEDKT